MTESAERQLSYLQQCLSSDKRPLGLFLGAGCPMAIRVGPDAQTPLIPDIAGITQIVREELLSSTDCGPLLKIIEGHFKDDGRDSPSVEDILTHLRGLRAVAGRAEVRGLSADQLDALDTFVCTLIHRVVDKSLPNPATPYHRVASWTDAVRRINPVEVFTTNYDLLMEQAFEDCRVPYFDGFGGVRKPFFDVQAIEGDVLPSRWARLWKLHGSINWYHAPDVGVFRGPTSGVEGSKRVIHPSHLKYDETRRMPYLAMIDRLRAFLKHPTATLVLCGYSFRRDDHINDVIVQGLQTTQTAIAFALLYGEIVEFPQAATLGRRHPNLVILARDGAIVGGRESKWPEREAEAVSDDYAPGVTWKKGDQGKGQDTLRAEVTLGDFAVFGKFLDELVGNVRRRAEAPSAQ